MKALRDIFIEAERLERTGRPYVLATLVGIDGPAYRRPGARMLIDPAGRTVGNVSAGCLEAEISEIALNVLDQQVPRICTFDLRASTGAGFGAGCGGVIRVLLEPVPSPTRLNPLDLLAVCLLQRKPGILVTIIGGKKEDLVARRLLVCHEETRADLPHSPLYEAIRASVDSFPRWVHDARPVEIMGVDLLLEHVTPPIQLVLYGDGPDVVPVTNLAKGLGWHTVLVGRRPPDTLVSLFPDAQDHLFLMHPENASRLVEFDVRSAALVMTHSYHRDRTILGALLTQSSVPYVGLLGHRARTARIIEGLQLASEARQRLYSPVGLDIGTESAEEIALAAVAEIQAVLHGRKGGFLRDRPGPIHPDHVR